LKQPVVLRIYKGDKLEAVRQFEHSQIVIGRNSDVQLELKDDGVALLHAMIEDRGGDYFVSDLGSQSGTFKAGNRILEDRLNSGDEITVGPYRIQFFIGVPKPAAPPRVDAGVPTTTTISYNSNVRQGARPEPPQAPPEPPPTLPSAPPNVKESEPKKEMKTFVPPTIPSGAPKGAPTGAPKKAGSASLAPTGKQKGTFAPPAPYKDIKDIIKPYKGSVVEVIVAWKDRVLSSNHFKEKGSVYISSNDEADVMVPIVASTSKYELLKIGTQVTVCLTQEMTGELIRDGETLTFADLSRQNKLRNVGTHFEIDLRQGEMVRLGLQGDLISIYVRYVADTPKPLVAPLLDMTSSEVTGIVLALAISAIMALYMNIYTPSPLLDDEARIDEPIRKAVVKFNPPTPKVQEAVEQPKEEKKTVVVKEKQKTQATAAPSVEKKADQGKAAEAAPNPNKTKRKTLTSQRQGGAVKTASKEGAGMKSEKPDPNKMGLLSAFGSKGMQKNLDKAYSGSGELAGMANEANGLAGNAENRAGDQLGSKLKDTGMGGKGSAAIGIAGVGTQGRGTGGTGYGTGGLGKKGSAQIHVDGQEGEFAAGMDKEAIRRVIREHLKEIRNCYERELQRSPDLYGKLVLEWDIEEQGRVSRCVVKSNALGNDSVAQCIASRLKTWKFPDPPANMVGRVSYPFVFSSQ